MIKVSVVEFNPGVTVLDWKSAELRDGNPVIDNVMGVDTGTLLSGVIVKLKVAC